MYNRTPDNKEEGLKQKFTKGLLQWNKRENKRQMPWKGEKDPYKIWLSEIILQQTRVEQGRSYYNRFIQTFRTIKELAEAPEQQVFKLWEGLGYYTRCRNLIAAAKYIWNELGGIFPVSYEAILSLKGVGAYTAAAIASFAYNLPYAVLDGNVFRVLSRIFDAEIPVDSTEGKKYFSDLAQQLLPVRQAGAYNQAIMDFGATVCKPQPECAHCFFAKHCKAFLQNKQLLLPVKAKKGKITTRWFHYIILKHKDHYAIRQRTAKDIWQNLYEFLLIESEKSLTQQKILTQLKKSYNFTPDDYTSVTYINESTQRLSHQIIHFSFLLFHVKKEVGIESFIWIPETDLKQYPFPKTVQQIAQQHLAPD